MKLFIYFSSQWYCWVISCISDWYLWILKKKRDWKRYSELHLFIHYTLIHWKLCHMLWRKHIYTHTFLKALLDIDFITTSYWYLTQCAMRRKKELYIYTMQVNLIIYFVQNTCYAWHDVHIDVGLFYFWTHESDLFVDVFLLLWLGEDDGCKHILSST